MNQFKKLIKKKNIFITAMVFAFNFSSKANENESKPLNDKYSSLIYFIVLIRMAF